MIFCHFTPVLTVLLAFLFLKETTTLLRKLSVCLSVSGVLFIFIMKGSRIDWSNMTGIVLLFLSCLVVAGYNVLARRLFQSFSPAEITYVMLGIAFLFLPCHSRGIQPKGRLINC
ncbi:hypothetical protein [Marinicrinis lubricantis]|uniref:EamA domain-containing protein n=1 Tax=Marinicrinis lubricantis TaxID=2086470 RepID=A0ABW1IJC3_9BACL